MSDGRKTKATSPRLLSGGNPQIAKGEGDGPVQDYISAMPGWKRCYTDYVQLQFFRGTSLKPMPPKPSKHDRVRYFDIHEQDELDDDRLRTWIEQAASLPGEPL